MFLFLEFFRELFPLFLLKCLVIVGTLEETPGGIPRLISGRTPGEIQDSFSGEIPVESLPLVKLLV